MRARRRFLIPLAVATLLDAAAAQIAVSPTGVNVASQGATTVFLTFGGLSADLIPAEAFWCGELVSAAPDVGTRCDTATLFGQLPLRFDHSRLGAGGAFTDVMTIPASVARRAYQAATAGRPAAFFYVRRFASRSGARSVYVAVTCRLTGGGATSPLSLVDVRLAFDAEAPVILLDANTPAPPSYADITYTGTGRLQGRWEIVRPGDALPTDDDLLTEATLAPEARGRQARWLPLERFNVFLPPTGRVRLDGPDPARLPRAADGTYLLLLRIEATDDADSRSDLAAAGAGQGLVASGAVAGFPMPVLRYLVGSGADPGSRDEPSGTLRLLAPRAGGAPLDAGWSFVWVPVAAAARYRVEIERADGTPVFEALVGTVAEYRPPPFLAARAAAGAGVAGVTALRWRVRALDARGRELGRSAWRPLVLAP